MIRLCAAATFVLVLLCAAPARAASNCDPDGVQSSFSIYRICMPAAEPTTTACSSSGPTDFRTPARRSAIPEDQLCIGTFCLNEVINSLGFGFATNSYSKTGMAIRQGKDDILDLVNIYTAQKGAPTKVYLVGASEGGIITALSLEQHPDVFSAGVAACGPVGDFPFQINYFGDARATFEVFFPGLIPGDPFRPDPAPGRDLDRLLRLHRQADRHGSRQPQPAGSVGQRSRNCRSTPTTTSDSVQVSVQDVLRYSVVNLADAAVTLGGFPFDNATRVYTGSFNDVVLNLIVPRATASPAAIAEMKTSYSTTGVLQRPLITLHTRLDQQVPYVHELLYALKTLASGSCSPGICRSPVDRFEHCNFTPEEVLVSFAIMLLYDGAIPDVSGISASHSREQIAAALATKLKRGR